MVPALPKFIFRLPLIVTSLKVEVPLEADTLPVRVAVRVPLTVALLKVDVPAAAVTLPVTSPVRAPENPVVAVIRVPVIAAGVTLPRTALLIVLAPVIVTPPLNTEIGVKVAAVLTVRVSIEAVPKAPEADVRRPAK
jgi:hypothetical protein